MISFGDKLVMVYDYGELEYQFPGDHPMNQERLTRAADMIACGPIEAKWFTFEPATIDQCLLAHSEDYLMALVKASVGLYTPARYGLDTDDMPSFNEMAKSAALIAGGTIRAVDLVLSGKAAYAFHLAGGLHHAHRTYASGFCVIDDATIAIRNAKIDNPNLRIAYLDIDAHHGDSVEEAFKDDGSVYTLSVHGYAPDFYPGTGGEIVNEPAIACWPMPKNPEWDQETRDAMWEGILVRFCQAIEKFNPDLIVAQIGTDAFCDPRIPFLNLSEAAYRRSIVRIKALADSTEAGLVCLGGGGYDMTSTPNLWYLAAKELSK